MTEIKKHIADEILQCIKEGAPATDISADDIVGMLEYPPDLSMGDIALPCFKISRVMRKAPNAIAGELADGISDGNIAHVSADGGYLNFKLSAHSPRARSKRSLRRAKNTARPRRERERRSSSTIRRPMSLSPSISGISVLPS